MAAGKAQKIWEPFPGSQERFLSCPVWEVLLHGNRGGGKSQPLHCNILTPKGWHTMGDMKLGSRICNPDGTTSTVIGIFPQGVLPTYKITFADGGVTYCSDDHLWFAKIANRIKSVQKHEYTPLGFKKGKIFTTKQLRELMLLYPNKRPIIPVPKEIKFTHQDTFKYKIDPYLLGLLLGDGGFSVDYRIGFTSIDSELVDYVKQFGFEKLDCETISYRAKTDSEIYKNIQKAGLLGLKSHEKFVPKRYLFGTKEERLALLQGLMDTDGYVAKKGTSGSFTSVSKQLIQDVRFLAHSLGGRVTVNSGIGSYRDKYGKLIKCRKFWNIRIVVSNIGDLFRLKRKNLRGEGNTYQHNYIGRKIVSISLSKIEPCQCIKVDNPNGLYITDDFIVTHNTDVLLMDFLQGVGIGYGIDYRGLLLREATTELGDVISKSKKWIPRIFPTAKFNNQRKIWTFEGGETLWLNYARVEDDYEQYHGHEYPWIAWEELTNHPLPNVYLKLMSCNRSSNVKIPKKYRSTCNPSGPGHTWVKERFIDKVPPEKLYFDEFKQSRTHIQSNLLENKALLASDPSYQAKLLAMTQDNKMLRDAWVYGSWDLISGGFFTDVWDKRIHVLEAFKIPRSWSLFRSFDWGSSKPWCVTYGAEANGEQPEAIEGQKIPFIPRGSVIIITEIYGWNGSANEGDRATSQEIAERVISVDYSLNLEYKLRVTPGPADTSIWEVRDGTSIAANLNTHGCRWTKAYKGSGSRIAGWAMIRQMLGAVKRGDLETPHLYFFEQAQHHIRTLPVMQRDKKKPEDIDSELEDHAMDSLRYLLTRKMMKFKRKKVGY